MIRHLTALAATVALCASCSSGDDNRSGGTPTTTTVPPTTEPYEGYTSDVYAEGANWLCHPMAELDHCDVDLDSTRVAADGSAQLEEHQAAPDPAVDCFYVYPTVSQDPTPNSDLEVGEEEVFAVANQAARYNQVCRMFAPVYRQGTVPMLLGTLGDEAEVDNELAQGDVVDSWRHYIANDNDGRGVILIGHSQGSGRLTDLIRTDIAGNPELEERIVAAHLIGSGPRVPIGADAPEGFGSITVCDDGRETGCFLSYASYREGGLPEETITDSEPGYESVCVNPAQLAGGNDVLDPYYPTQQIGALVEAIGAGPGAYSDPARNAEITTPYFTPTDFVNGECVSEEGVNYLRISVNADPNDPRADDISGDIPFLPDFGLHLVDMSLAMGDLVAVAETQAQSYLQ